MRKTIPSQDLRWAKLQANPTCSKCGQKKTVNDFPRRAVDYQCNACRRDYAREAYRQKRAAMSPEELAAEKAKINARQNKRRSDALAAMPADELAAYKERINRDNTIRRLAVRDQVYQAYGGYRCACCGETERAFLSIDHIHNDGAKHKREEKLHTGEQLYRWLVRKGFPPGFQILCMNCQWGKRNNNGVCPHQGKV